MPRRGRKEQEPEHSEPKLAKRDEADSKSPLDFSTPEKLFESLISPVTSDAFFRDYWETKVLLLQGRDPAFTDYFQTLFRLSDLKHIAGGGIYYERDVNVFKCRDGKKIALPRHGKATYLHLLKDFGSGKATIQFHQPQRFNDALWHIMEKLECFFGALVGSNVYITPQDSQGLPAHYDDVEVFILQLEGEKRWRLYNPVVPLARDYSVVPEDQIGSPTHDFVLKPGDLLYFPRGVIHQAQALPGSSHSTHVTISTYQNNSWSDYLQDLLPGILFDAAKANIDLRRGIPRQQILSLDTPGVIQQISSLLNTVAKGLESHRHIRSFEILRDFMASRLPPFLDNKEPGQTSGMPPKLNSTVQLLYRDYSFFTVDHVAEESNAAAEQVVYVYHSLKNTRETHMMAMQEEDRPVTGLRFPLPYANALKRIWESESVSVGKLPLDRDEDKENLALSLWTEGLLAIVP
ncbi:ribosomal oxygenase 2 L homeolog [Xenopus laevis]|uniref:Bifunctional lysine-specific demethylase and histidyl-hydroxylase n=1 Tax=Xenopus laevis TaxID=8355 RepID=Q6DDJ7_XENLA|nr:ribosomal oxygenase 2 L homeolog [Xenopus laevis]AAH77562.1 Mina-prov protein [Xenopus laevis]